MNKSLKIQKQICKLQIFGVAGIVLSLILAIGLSAIPWIMYQLHPLVVLGLCVGIFMFLGWVVELSFECAKKSLYKKMDDYLNIEIDTTHYINLLESTKDKFVNITKQNYFFSIKSTIDNYAIYDARNIDESIDFKKQHGQNMALLKKKYPDIRNKSFFQNHLRIDVQVYIVDHLTPVFKKYISINKNRLYSIGKFRCVLEINSSQLIIPSFLPKGISLHDSIFYWKIIRFLEDYRFSYIP